MLSSKDALVIGRQLSSADALVLFAPVDGGLEQSQVDPEVVESVLIQYPELATAEGLSSFLAVLAEGIVSDDSFQYGFYGVLPHHGRSTIIMFNARDPIDQELAWLRF